jgi:hypothetical protein
MLAGLERSRGKASITIEVSKSPNENSVDYDRGEQYCRQAVDWFLEKFAVDYPDTMVYLYKKLLPSLPDFAMAESMHRFSLNYLSIHQRPMDVSSATLFDYSTVAILPALMRELIISLRHLLALAVLVFELVVISSSRGTAMNMAMNAMCRTAVLQDGTPDAISQSTPSVFVDKNLSCVRSPATIERSLPNASHFLINNISPSDAEFPFHPHNTRQDLFVWGFSTPRSFLLFPLLDSSSGWT